MPARSAKRKQRLGGFEILVETDITPKYFETAYQNCPAVACNCQGSGPQKTLPALQAPSTDIAFFHTLYVPYSVLDLLRYFSPAFHSPSFPFDICLAKRFGISYQ